MLLPFTAYCLLPIVYCLISCWGKVSEFGWPYIQKVNGQCKQKNQGIFGRIVPYIFVYFGPPLPSGGTHVMIS
jgi:hypothetical protein